MAAIGLEDRQVPSRSASLQRMLDLERKYKMARLHSNHASPTDESEPSFALPVKTSLQARRRSSREILPPHERDHMHRGIQRNSPTPSLSIAIPPPLSKRKNGDMTPKAVLEDFAEPRSKTVTFVPSHENNEDSEEEDDDEDQKSVQSSICHSPSWEGYGQQRKKKKAEAEQRRKDKEKAEQEVKAAKKRLGNRLQKTGLTADTSSSTSKAVSKLQDNQKTSSDQTLKMAQRPASTSRALLPAWGLAIGSGSFVGGLPHTYAPTVVNALAMVPKTAEQEIEERRAQNTKASDAAIMNSNHPALRNQPEQQRLLPPRSQSDLEQHVAHERPYLQKSHSMIADRNYSIPAPLKSPRNMTFSDVSSGMHYPPTSSRTHILRNAPNHTRSNSASAATVEMTEEIPRSSRGQQYFSNDRSTFYMGSNNSDEALEITAVSEERGRRRAEVPGYVRQSREQSAERSLTGFLDEMTASSEPQSPKHLTSSQQSRGHFSLFSRAKQDIVGLKEIVDRSTQSRVSSDNESRTREPTVGGPPLALHSQQPGAVFEPQAISGGIFNSLRAKMNRRSSSSSSTPSTIRSSQGRPAPLSNLAYKANTESPIPSSALSSKVSSPQHPPEDFMETPRAVPPINGRVEQRPQAKVAQAPGSRPSEGSSTSSYQNDSSAPPSPATTPDTSRPQSARGGSITLEEVKRAGMKDTLLMPEDLRQQRTHPIRASAAMDSPRLTHAQQPLRQQLGSMATLRPSSKGRELDFAKSEPSRSRARLLEDQEFTNLHDQEARSHPQTKSRHAQQSSRPNSRGRLLETLTNPAEDDEKPATDDDRWTRSAMPIEFDAQSFVTSLTNLDGVGSTTSLVPDTDFKGNGEIGSHSRSSSRHSHEDEGTRKRPSSSERPRSRSSRRNERSRVSQNRHMSIVNEEPRMVDSMLEQAHEDFDLDENDRPIAPADQSYRESGSAPSKKQEHNKSFKGRAQQSMRNSAPISTEPQRQQPKSPTEQSPSYASGRVSPASSSHMKEVRRSAPIGPSPLSNGLRPATKANMSIPAVLPRPALKSTHSTPVGSVVRPQIPKASSAGASGPATTNSALVHEVDTTKPVAKMLVECCRCRFFLDMPSRVYQYMANPESTVRDTALGVSGVVATTVRCPWCSHGMTTECCAGYAAVVYLKERLH